MKLTAQVVNDELARRGHTALLRKGRGTFEFWSGDAADWLDRTVKVRTINTLTLKQWMQEFDRLKELNQQILGTVGRSRTADRGSKRSV
jgi:hypothetical protein